MRIQILIRRHLISFANRAIRRRIEDDKQN